MWTQHGAKLTGGGESGPGLFGFGVALSSDASTAVIGGWEDAGEGAAWVFVPPASGATWVQQGTKLTVSDAIGSAFFGSDVALSATGATAVVGGPFDNARVGAAWVFSTGPAEAVIQTRISSETNSLCINPTPGFTPSFSSSPPDGNYAPNYAPLVTSNVTGEPFPETGANCAPPTSLQSLSHPVAIPTFYAANATIPGTSWVGIASSGSDAENSPDLPPGGPVGKYYIYNAKFDLQCQAQLEGSELNGEMLADNVVAVFLNGTLLKSQETTTEAIEGGNRDFPTPFHTSTGPFRSANTLQFVVYDESPGETGLDFIATIASPKCHRPGLEPSEVVLNSPSELTFHANVDPDGWKITECELQYGKTSEYEGSAACRPLPGSGDKPVAVSAVVKGLAADKSYHYRFVATNAIGTTESSDEVATTEPEGGGSGSPGAPE